MARAERPADAAPSEPDGWVAGASAEGAPSASVRCSGGMGRHHLDQSGVPKIE